MPEEKPEGEKTRLVVHLTKGTAVGHYVIVEKIGAGGMGEVYLAEDTELNRKVALKFLSPHLCQDADCRTRFKREAQAAAKLNHPNIVTIYEVSEFNGRPFFAMEYVEGQSLRELIKAKELPIERVIDLAIQICEGLHKAHQSGIVHRDVKPANILIDVDGRAKILDFGLASVAGSDHLTKTGSTLGTIGYMSPEQVRGEQVDHRTDIFSLGVVLYELIAGRQPFKGDNDPATSRNIIDHDPEPLARYKSGVNAEFQRVISKALSKDRSTRYQHVDDLAADLKQLLSPSGSLPVKRSRRMRIMVPALIVIVLSAIGLIFKPWELAMESSKDSNTDVKRVVVVPFRNQTGDPSLDPLGRMVADWTTQSLLQTGLAEVVLPEMLSDLDASKGVRSVVDATGATLLVTGSYYKVGDSIQFQAQVMNVDGKMLQAIEPIYSPIKKVMDGVESVRQRVLGALAILLDERLLGTSAQSAPPPKYEAYQEFIQGRVHNNRSDWDGALDHLMKAYTLDTLFLEPLLGACGASSNSARWALSDSLVQFLELRRSRLNAIQQLRLDAASGSVSGDLLKGLNAMRQAAKLAPGSSFAYMWGVYASWLNRPRECIEAFKTMDPERGWARGWMQYWYFLTLSYHILGEHKQELKAAQHARRLYPESPSPFYSETRALAAMGEVQEVKQSLEQCASLSVNAGVAPPNQLYQAGIELRAHGHEDQAMAMLDEAIRWYESQPSEKLDSLREGYAMTLYNARRWDKAKTIYEELAKKFPKDSAGRGYESYLGFIAARQGDRTRAMEVSEWLKNLRGPYLFGGNTYERACIAAILGEKDQAVTLLKESFLQGSRFNIEVHRDFDLESLWNYPPFIEFLKPKG